MRVYSLRDRLGIAESGSFRLKKYEKKKLCEMVFVVFTTMMILSDCSSFFGSWVYNLKYISLMGMAIYILGKSINYGIPVKKVLLCFSGLIILLLCIPLQEGSFSRFQAICLYLLVFIFACFSPATRLDGRGLYKVALFDLLIVILLLVASYSDCIEQWSYYSDIGRPRLRGCFSNPNSLGGISATIFIMLVIGYHCDLKGKTSKGTFALAVVSAFFLLIISGSRTSMLMVLGFSCVLFYFLVSKRAASRAGRVLVVFFFCIMIGAIGLYAMYMLSDDVTVASRVEPFREIQIKGLSSYVGTGYVSSGGISEVAEQAGGAVDMLWVSAFYRVGLIGIIGYALLFAGALWTKNGQRKNFLAVALIVALLLQTLGESYLTSVMSFVSSMNWILLALVNPLFRSWEYEVMNKQKGAMT